MSEKIMDAINDLNHVFHEYKKANDERLVKLEKGESVTEVVAKMEKIQDSYQDVSETIKNIETEIAAGKRKAIGGEAGEDKLKNFAKALANWDETALKSFKNDVRTSEGGDGGYAVPEELDSIVDSYLMDDVAMLRICNVKRFEADYKKLVTVSGGVTANSAELATVTKTDSGTIVRISPVNGKRIAKQLVSQEANEDLIFDPEEWVRENIAMVMAEDIEGELISGVGNNATKGFLKYPLSTSQDAERNFGEIQKVLSGKSGDFLDLDTSTHVNPVDRLKDLRTALKGRYRRNARWLFNRFTEGELMKLKDANENYIFQPASAKGEESKILGYGYTLSDSMPDIAADSLSIAFGDFKRGITIQLKPGLYVVRDNITAYPNVFLNFSKRYGLMLRDSRAIKVMQFSAS